ncbi:helix-turn-helix domain-containing protein [Nocardia jejuensis]|uniref:helix-turn-helix domain-containing protein n=1 Tax=Nocardia jejuensis TaxID=328049 RepID=UPI0009FDA6A2|nr:helix-turn-helix domain-containing protein [Nocardia jejuensis]
MTPSAECIHRPSPLQLPTLGQLLRRLRDARRISRERLAFNAGVSASYIAHLEHGHRERPTREVVHALIRYLDRVGPITAAEHRHLRDLAGWGIGEEPTLERLRGEITADMRETLDRYDPHLAAYLDSRWNLLAWNRSFAHAFPGLTPDGNVLHWLLGNPVARQVVLEWEQEVRLMVQWLRGLIAGTGDPESAVAFLAELGQYEQFCRYWDEGIVAYGRDRPDLYLRDLDTGDVRTIPVQVFQVGSVVHADHVRILLGISPSTTSAGFPE